MRTQPREVRCTACGILLATVGEAGLVIRRGDLQATIDGELRAALVCYRRTCRRLNVVRHSSTARSEVATA